KQRRNDCAQQNRRDDKRDLLGVQQAAVRQRERRLQIRQRAGNDTHVNAVKQPTQAGDQEKKTIVAGLGGFVFYVSHGFVFLRPPTVCAAWYRRISGRPSP